MEALRDPSFEEKMDDGYILVVDDDEDMLVSCSQILRGNGFRVDVSDDGSDALAKIKSRRYDVVVTDIKMPGLGGMDLLRAIRVAHTELPVIMMTGYLDVGTAVEAMKLGACDYLTKPFQPEELKVAVGKAIEGRIQTSGDRAEARTCRLRNGRSTIVGTSEEIQQVQRMIDRIAATDSTVLITGETGTGKELVAHRIHLTSSRAHTQMVVLNCPAIPGDLLESELFGHEKGSFTGAIRKKRGCFELAHGSTLFLDEIGDTSLDLQTKLMRSLETKEIRPVGGEGSTFVDTRIIAATNRDLKQAIQEGRFREDLYYRLNVVPIYVPPLRDRREDIPVLVEHFLKRYCAQMNKDIPGIREDALNALVAYDWPGNVRELENAIERAVVLRESGWLETLDFHPTITEDNTLGSSGTSGRAAGSEEMPSLKKIEHDYIYEVLRATKWNKKKAAEILGISTVTIWRKIEPRDKRKGR